MSKSSSKSLSEFLIKHQWIEVTPNIWACEANCFTQISTTAAYKIQIQLNELKSRKNKLRKN